MLQPFLVGRYVRLRPFVVAAVITAGAILAGLPGALLAVPVTAAVHAAAERIDLPQEPPGGRAARGCIDSPGGGGSGIRAATAAPVLTPLTSATGIRSRMRGSRLPRRLRREATEATSGRAIRMAERAVQPASPPFPRAGRVSSTKPRSWQEATPTR